MLVEREKRGGIVISLQNQPVLYAGKQIHIVYFGLFAALNAMAIVTVFYYYLYLHGFPFTPNVLYWLPLGGVMIWSGARLMHLLSLGKKLFRNPGKYLFETGFYFQGGILGALCWSILFAYANDISLIIVWDGLCIGTLLGQSFGRIGCFNYGCCYGKPTGSQWGVTYTNVQSKILRLHPELQGIHVHPVQLYKAGLNLAAFLILLFLISVLPVGGIVSVFLIYHGITRIVMERFRADIYFKQGRNWLTFYLSWAAIVATLPLQIYGRAIDPNFMMRVTLDEPHRITTIVQLFGQKSYLGWTILLVGALVFVGYGFHGKTLGRFPFPERGQDENKDHDHRSRTLWN